MEVGRRDLDRDLSHPLLTLVSMETVTLVSALVLAVSVAIGMTLAWSRQRRAAPAVDTDALIQQLAAMAGTTFQAHLETGRSHLAHQKEFIDRKWEGVASKLTGELSELRFLVAELQKERAAQHAGLTENLHNAARQQKLLLDSTQRLNQVLSNPQARGQWGERMAEDILRAAGMVEGINYLTQQTTIAGTRPDFTFNLPDGQLLHMDAKFPLDAYSRYVGAGSDIDRRTAIREFGVAVKGHVKALADREAYVESTSTVGFVLMFIPNDGIYAFVHEHHRRIFDEALSRRVVICSPSTLFAMLALVRQAMDTLAMEQSSREILDHLSCFADQWKQYVKQFDLVGRHLGRLNSAFEKLSVTRRNQLERQLDRIAELKNGTHPDRLEPAA